jgi:predicted RNA-binding protein YlqC (UPF0109 family)
MKEILGYLLNKILKNPAALVINESEEAGVVVFNVKVDPAETGWVIGKGGRTIKSLRNILRIIAIKEGKRVDIRLENEAPAEQLTPK